VRSYAGKYSVTRRTSCLSGSADHAGDPGNGQEPLLAGRAVARAPRVSAVAFATVWADPASTHGLMHVMSYNRGHSARRFPEVSV
jgi:hypothetical protein